MATTLSTTGAATFGGNVANLASQIHGQPDMLLKLGQSKLLFGVRETK
jgi:hypothetical protein